jgi:hypothetical protein
MKRVPVVALWACTLLVGPVPAAPFRIENGLGFVSLRDAKGFRAAWGALAEDAKLTGKLADHLTRDQVASAVALEVNIAVADFFGPGGPHSSLDDELQRFLSGGGRFHTGRLPDGFENRRPAKHVVLLIRTKDGGYGLITFYSGFVVVEMNRRIGVVLDEAEDKGKDNKGKGKEPGDPAAPAADPITAEMRAALTKANAVHDRMDWKVVDDAVTELHREIARHDPKVFVPLAVPHLMRLAPRDTATRVLLRKALAEGWLDEFAARTYLVQAGDTPGPHVTALIQAVGGPDRKARRAALNALRGVGAAGADALPALRKLVDDAKADPADYRRAYTARDEVPDHVLAYWAITRIEADLKAPAIPPAVPGAGGPARR